MRQYVLSVSVCWLLFSSLCAIQVDGADEEINCDPNVARKPAKVVSFRPIFHRVFKSNAAEIRRSH